MFKYIVYAGGGALLCIIILICWLIFLKKKQERISNVEIINSPERNKVAPLAPKSKPNFDMTDDEVGQVFKS